MKQKRFFALIRAAALTFGLAGCQGDIVAESVNTEQITEETTTAGTNLTDNEAEQKQADLNREENSYNILIGKKVYRKYSEKVSLDNASETDLEALFEFECIKTLNLRYDDTPEMDFGILKELESVERLSVSGVNAADLAVVSEMKGFKKLTLENCVIDDFSFLAGSSVESLSIRNCEIGEMYFPDGLNRLDFLEISQSPLETLDGIPTLKNLRCLDLSQTEIKDISPLGDMQSLETLFLAENNIEDISPIGKLSKLTNLEVRSKSVNDFDVLPQVSTLEKLDISNNELHDISFLENMQQLKELSVSNCSISDIGCIGNLTRLEVLYLSDNFISDISSIKELKKLKNIDISGNSIENIDVMAGFDDLEYLNISGNEVTDITVLGECDSLTGINIVGNPLNDEQIEDFFENNPQISNLFGQ